MENQALWQCLIGEPAVQPKTASQPLIHHKISSTVVPSNSVAETVAEVRAEKIADQKIQDSLSSFIVLWRCISQVFTSSQKLGVMAVELELTGADKPNKLQYTHLCSKKTSGSMAEKLFFEEAQTVSNIASMTASSQGKCDSGSRGSEVFVDSSRKLLWLC